MSAFTPSVVAQSKNAPVVNPSAPLPEVTRPDTAPKPMTQEEYQAERAMLLAELAQLKAKKANAHSQIKVSLKGAVSVYGLGRWPVTLYKSQMLAFLGMADEIKAFMLANDALLSVKEDDGTVTSAETQAPATEIPAVFKVS